jgi:membrane fusion protein (multidrug efflux system)
LVKVEPVKRASIARTLDLTGETVATTSVVIAATKEGPVHFCPWREGDAVKAGERLVVIDREVHRAEVRAAQAALAVAKAWLEDIEAGARPEEIRRAEADVRRWKASLEEARKSLKRQAELMEKDFTAQEKVDKASERVEVVRAGLAFAEETLKMLKSGPTPTKLAVQEAVVEEKAARLDIAKAHLAECVIVAPFAATITKVHVRPGDLASPKAPLVEIIDAASIVLRFAVPEAHATVVHKGMPLKVTLDTYPGRAFSGQVVRVYPELDPTMRTRTVEAVIEDSVNPVPHTFARLTLELQAAENVIVVPIEAIRATPKGGRVLFVIKEGRAVRRKVKLGIEGKKRVQVISGLEPGEQVVIAGNERLKDGVPVRIAGKGKGPAGKPPGAVGSPLSAGQRTNPGEGK